MKKLRILWKPKYSLDNGIDSLIKLYNNLSIHNFSNV